mmetsp:Transcript_1117/g.2219  ORF Transcript_1117/g.2219 Transcript_1117/m.2219 type:complete len:260 (-) Transcript_1117:128-907(-)
MTKQQQQFVWRFGYGSNIGMATLREKKNLNPSKYLVGTIQGWELYFMSGFQHVEPGWAAIRPSSSCGDDDKKLHGSAFLIPQEEADSLDRQEGGYDVLPCTFTSYEGEIVQGVGLYVPKKKHTEGTEEGTPSLRYLRLLQNGAREGGLSQEWIHRLDSVEYYITPPNVRAQTQQWIAEFHADPNRKDVLWSMEELAKHDGKQSQQSSSFPVHTSVMEYVIQVDQCWVFSSWKGHNVTRRNLLQFQGKSLDVNGLKMSFI